MKSIKYIFVTCLYQVLVQHQVAQDLIPMIDTSGCGKTKGCFRTPGICEEDKCKYILTWKMDASGKTVDFEFSAAVEQSSPWIALGFSNDAMMMIPVHLTKGGDWSQDVFTIAQNSAFTSQMQFKPIKLHVHVYLSDISCLNKAQTSVTDCIVNASASNDIVIQSSFNPGYMNEVLSPDSKLGLLVNRSEGVFVNKRLYCRFTRLVELPKPNPQVANLSNSYYMLLGEGPATENGLKLKHSEIPVASPRKVSVSEIVDIHTESLIVYHASLMIVAWMLVSSVGVMFSRHYKNVWGFEIFNKKIWFQIHRSAMAITFVLSVTGVVVIFIDLTSAPLVKQKLHPILGMIVLCMITLNIIIGIIRPSPGSGRRQLFNWAHSLIGNGAHVVAAVTMFFGVHALGQRIHIQPWLEWLVVAFIVWRLLFDLVMTIEKYYHREDLRVAYVEMSGSADDIIIESKTLCFKKVTLTVYIVVVTGLTVVVLYGTVSPFCR